MSIKRILFPVVVVLLLGTCLAGVSCTSRKSACHSDWQYKAKKMQKNRSNYGTIYEAKTKPVRKNYVISNRR